MKKLFLILFSFAFLLLPHEAVTKTTFYDEEVAFFGNDDLRLWITVKKFKVEAGGGENFGTLLKVEYETESVETLENYGPVLFIRGCKFNSTKDKTGVVHKRIGFSKPHFDDVVPFCFPDWVIDSLDKDPFFNSRAGYNRIHYYRWFDNDKETIYGRKKPEIPRLYVSEHPGLVAFFANGIANNISLEVKVCIYKTEDIPRRTVQEDVDFAEPIHCFSFVNSFVYNHDIEKFSQALPWIHFA